jgi:hypothetical protein
MLEIDGSRATPAVHEVPRALRQRGRGAPETVDADHVRAEVREQHRGEWPRPDARDLDDPDAVQRAGCAHRVSFVRMCCRS